MTYPKVDIVLVGDVNETTSVCSYSILNTIENYSLYLEPYVGYNKSLNNGAKQGDSEYIAFCNNDLKFQKGWLPPLLKALETYHSVSPWCPLTHKQWWGKAKPSKPFSSYQSGKCVAGWFIMMKRKTWERIGGFDERFTFWYCDDSYAQQLKRIGMRHALIPNSIVHHLQSKTLQTLPKEQQKELTTDQTKLFEKTYGKHR